MARMSSRATGIVALVAMLSATPARPAGQVVDGTTAQTDFRRGAALVRVDAYVSERGRAVPSLTAQDFEVLEDGVRQKIATFEHVQVEPAGAQEARREPGSVRESQEAAGEARARVFVIFLDTYHTSVDGSHAIRTPLANLLDRLVGQDDLIAVMTPDMRPADITFGRRTTTIETMLTEQWSWGVRDNPARLEPVDERDLSCYPDEGRTAGLARAMSLRRREQRTLDALDGLVGHLAGVREERKAVLAITEGWVLYEPDYRRLGDEPVAPPLVGVERGRFTPSEHSTSGGGVRAACDAERSHLLQLDHRLRLRDIEQVANRGNVSFYPVDPRGLVVFDSPLSSPLPPSQDREQLSRRLSNLRELATATDGFAIVDTQNIEPGFRRIADDLSAYYLIGYYSTNQKLDGKFREIKVRVLRSGFDVRARRGYRAQSEKEAGTPSATGSPASNKATVSAALERLASTSRGEPPLTVAATSWRLASGQPHLWVVGEIGAQTARLDEWRGGGDVTMTLLDGERTIAVHRATIVAGTRRFVASVPIESAGAFTLQARARPVAGAVPISASVIVAPARDEARTGRPVVSRRGQGRVPFEPTSDPRFRRTERIRVEWPAHPATVVERARVLDRAGNPIDLPASVSERVDEDGVRWIAVDVNLAPLAAGDYLVELAAPEPVLEAFRIVP